MIDRDDHQMQQPQESDEEHDDGDLGDMLNEMRVLLPGAQTLTAFLIILPFNGGFAEIKEEEKIVYIITFLCSIVALILFAAPAAHHRLQRPLINREAFKNMANRYIIAGLVPLSCALVLGTQLVISQVFTSRLVSWSVPGFVALCILSLWWFVPIRRRAVQQQGANS